MTYQLSDGNPDGTVLGQSATDKVGFFGATPVVQQSNLAAVVTTAISSTGAYAFTTAAQGNDLVARVNSILTQLQNFGLQAGS